MGKNTRALSLFSGVGGFDLGARIAGLRVRLASDIDSDALGLLARPWRTPTLPGDIDDLLPRKLVQAWPYAEPPRILFGGPPCTPFSHAGFWLDSKRDGLDPARHLLTSYAMCLETLGPDAFVLENVPGLAFKTHRHHLAGFVSAAEDLDYAVSWAVLSASNYGVAQRRRRLFVTGIRNSEAVDLETWPDWPERSAGWAIGGLECSESAEADELPGSLYRQLVSVVPPGRNYLHFTERHGWHPPLFKNRGRYWSFLLKAHPDRPAPTLPAQRLTYNGPFHWTGRHLRVREMARLQGFPDWYPISANLTQARRHIGNAVPPLLGAAVLCRVRQTLGDVKPSSWPQALRVSLDPDASWSAVVDTYPSPLRASGIVV